MVKTSREKNNVNLRREMENLDQGVDQLECPGGVQGDENFDSKTEN